MKYGNKSQFRRSGVAEKLKGQPNLQEKKLVKVYFNGRLLMDVQSTHICAWGNHLRAIKISLRIISVEIYEWGHVLVEFHGYTNQRTLFSH